MSCNSCSNVTLPGVAGPVGAAGANGTNGNGISSIAFLSTTNPGGTAGVAGYTDTYRITYTDSPTFDYSITNGANGGVGTDGAVLLKSISSATSDYTVNSYGLSSVVSGDSFGANGWEVTQGTLNENLDTLRLSGLILVTQGDYLKKASVTFGSSGSPTTLNIGISSYPLQAQFTIMGMEFEIDLIRVSSTTVRVESKSKVLFPTTSGIPTLYSYANEEVQSFDEQSVYKNNQVITVNDLSTGVNYARVLLDTGDPSEPLKLVNCKLLKFKKV